MKAARAGPVEIVVPATDAKPRGVFNLLLSRALLLNKKFVNGLGDCTAVLSTELGAAGNNRTHPKFLDIYATQGAAGVKDLKGPLTRLFCC